MFRTAASVLALLLALPCTGQPQEPLTTIAFGSCARSDRDQPIWDTIVAQDPQLFLFIGDNIYADVPDKPTTPNDIAVKYAELGAMPGYQKLKATCPILATWDDHDYGLNDAGVEYPLKDASQALLLTFFEEPADSPRWTRPGVYGAWTFGPEGKRVQVILLDTRYFRSPLTRNPKGRVKGLGPYIPNADGQGTLLGDAQWAWLEQQLKQPADLRIIASSIQVIAHEHRWETWGNMPHERRRLYQLIANAKANGVLFISGDRHLVEISRDTEKGVPYPLYDLTSSGFNWGSNTVNDPNRFRIGGVYRQPNFGLIRIDWSDDDPVITLEGVSGAGEVLTSTRFPLSELEL